MSQSRRANSSVSSRTSVQGVMDRVRGNVVKTVQDELVEMAEFMEDIVRRQNQFYFTTMSQKVIGRKQTPKFVREQTGERWKPLSKPTINRKIREGKDAKAFFRDSGDLQRELLKIRGQQAQFAYAPLGGGLVDTKLKMKPLTSEADIDRISAASGVSRKQIRPNMQGEITIFPFGKGFDADELRNPGSAGDVHDIDVASKLVNHRGNQDRPFRYAYYLWWVNDHLPNLVRKKLG